MPSEISRNKNFRSRLLAKAGYKRRLFLECLIDRPIEPIASRMAVDIRPLAAGDADDFVMFRDGPDASIFLERLEKGQRCYAATVDGRIASVTWVARESATLWALDADFKLGTGTLYVFDSYTHPDFRGQWIQAPIFQTIRRDYARIGNHRAVTFVESTNMANLRSRARTGFRVRGSVWRIRLGCRTWYLSSGRSPALVCHKRRT